MHLIAGCVEGSAGVVIFKRTDGGRTLEEVVRNTDGHLCVVVTLEERWIGLLLT